MTVRVPARAIAAMAALLLVLGMTIVAMTVAADGELGLVLAAEKSPEKGDTGAACPETSPNAGGSPPCGVDGAGDGKDGKDGKDGTGNACPPSSPNAGGSPPCGQDGDDEPECEEGQTFNPETGACEDDDTGEPECEEGQTFNPETGACEDDEVETQRCDTPDGIELLDDGTIALFLHENDPTGLSSNPTAEGSLSGEVYDGGKDTPLEPLTDEVGCLVSLTGAL